LLDVGCLDGRERGECSSLAPFFFLGEGVLKREGLGLGCGFDQSLKRDFTV